MILSNRNRSTQGFSFTEVMASIVILSLGILAATRMQATALSANLAPVNSQEAAIIARETIEVLASGQAPNPTVNGYIVNATRTGCQFGATLVCAGAGTDLEQLTVTVTDPNGSIEPYTVSTLRVP
ncbi:prepilin-type N-terminal cleavage/methylation domain-containing protein [Synechococcus sp. PCC 7336]|uniref:type IV pilus modification PilV family protein n=1 Tax=Synechococcus sp. PCC 7336 TaxID=195250 RepID=UPI0012EA2454|nr:prepilin-type N-terminal cleavage/methylation domain-containing protein [Synechococcus sp. PCC 7336]